MKTKKKCQRKKEQINPPTYETLALAEKAHIEPAFNLSRPSEENVVETREWSIENKL